MTTYRVITVTYNNGNAEKFAFDPFQQDKFWITKEKLCADQFSHKEIKDIHVGLEIY